MHKHFTKTKKIHTKLWIEIEMKMNIHCIFWKSKQMDKLHYKFVQVVKNMVANQVIFKGIKNVLNVLRIVNFV